MGLIYLLLIFSFSSFGQAIPQVNVLKNPESLEDFKHEIKGCPENSECDQIMGHMFTQWNKLIEKIRTDKSTKSMQLLEQYRKKYGIPVEFYTNHKTKNVFGPALYNSSCKHHNPKEGEKIFRGISFMKGTTDKVAIIWRDQAQHEIPLEKNIFLQELKIYYPGSIITYRIPLLDQPLYVENKNIFILKEEDGFYYLLKITPQGQWNIIPINFSRLSYFENKKSEVKCPIVEKASDIFETHFCKSVWDDTTKQNVIYRSEMGCVISN